MKKIGYFAIGFFALSSAAWAGTFVTGYGNTRPQAVADAEGKARDLARQKRTCYEYVKPKQCTQDSTGGWTCQASVANHAGSCGGEDKIRP